MYKEILTDDDSITYFNEAVGEKYHSQSGALDEALKKHVIPADLLSREHPIILDVCYGLGYNSFVALSLLAQNHKDASFILLENDPVIAQKGTEITLPKVLQYAQEFFAQVLLHPRVECKTKQYQGIFYDDDFRVTLRQLPENSVDVVFFDPFSPGKMPELWTEEVFVELFRVMKTGSVLTTYSCARKVRDAMKAAGFVVENGPVVGRKSPGTLAKKV